MQSGLRWRLLRRTKAVARLGPGHSVAQRLDATAVVVALGGVHLLWARTWWHNRRERRVSGGPSHP
ncbi:hypothetical protein [Streptomyces albiflavescens]|uniref:hypothetical protein n=1 Tax=Streptomyces albiflavescens TaxID=1623582 RepID=UPI00166D11D9|nr:hypothetical protein [Streptomyces albiflavescens]